MDARGWPSASRPCAAPAIHRTKPSRTAKRTKRASGPGPRVYGTGYLMEWQRVYYKMGIAISSVAQFEMELQRAKVLEHDLIKSYVRLPDLQQRRMVEFAHQIGVPVATHEIFPAAMVGVDNTEHTSATSRRGYSPKMATLQRSYDDVIQLFGKSGRTFCPMISGGGTRHLFELEPALKNDARFKLYPGWIQRQVASQPATINAGGGGDPSGGSGRMVLDVMRAGGLVVAGTDTPNAINLHGELMSYVMAGMSNYDALRDGHRQPRARPCPQRRNDRTRQARRSRRGRRQPAGERGERAPRPAGRRQRPLVRARSTARATAADHDAVAPTVQQGEARAQIELCVRRGIRALHGVCGRCAAGVGHRARAPMTPGPCCPASV